MSSEGMTAEEPVEGRRWFDVLSDLVDRLSERLAAALFRFGIRVTLPALVALVTLDVILRYVFNAPLQWARDVNGLLLLTTTFCSLPHSWDRSAHIRMEIFYERFSETRRRSVDVVCAFAGIVFFGFMAFQGARFVPFMIATGETGEDLQFPIWPAMAVLAFCSFVTVVRIFSNPAGTDELLRYRRDPDGEHGGGGAL